MYVVGLAFACLANIGGTRRVFTRTDPSHVDSSLEFWSTEKHNIDHNSLKLQNVLNLPTSRSRDGAAMARLLLGLTPSFLHASSQVLHRSAQPLATVGTTIDPPLVRAARGEVLEHPTVWLFRQAGRHMSEYRTYKNETGKMFLDFLKNSTDMATITLQPVERYGVDAAILFSDILVVPQAMGIKLEMPGGVGIMVANPLKTGKDLERLDMPADGADAARLVQGKLGHIMEAVRLIVDTLNEQYDGKPLIGFSAAPWTIFYYMVGGNSKEENIQKKLGARFLKEHPEAAQHLLDSITNVVTEYLSAQAASGCKVLQIFDALANETMISEEQYKSVALPCIKKIRDELKSRYPEIPQIVFARGAGYSLPLLKDIGFDVLTIDKCVNLATVRDEVPDVCLQGAFDPAFLVRADGYDEAKVREETVKMLQFLGPENLIVNLLEGIPKNADQDLVHTFVETVQAYPELPNSHN